MRPKRLTTTEVATLSTTLPNMLHDCCNAALIIVYYDLNEPLWLRSLMLRIDATPAPHSWWFGDLKCKNKNVTPAPHSYWCGDLECVNMILHQPQHSYWCDDLECGDMTVHRPQHGYWCDDLEWSAMAPPDDMTEVLLTWFLILYVQYYATPSEDRLRSKQLTL